MTLTSPGPRALTRPPATLSVTNRKTPRTGPDPPGGMIDAANPGRRRPGAVDLENQLGHEGRVTRLTGLAIPRPMAEAGPGNVDWRQIGGLVRRGCPPLLVLRIVR